METFCAVVQEEGFRKAAEKLYISQASVSQHISWIEKRFGINLFQRKGRGVILTPEGKAFHSLSLDILQKVTELPKSLQSRQELATGSLKLAMTFQATSPEIARVVAIFRKSYPNISFTLRQIREREISNVIEEGSTEIVLMGRNPGESLSPNFTSQSVIQTPLVFVGSPHEFNFIGSRELRMEEISTFDFIVFPEGTALRTCFDGFVIDNQIRVKKVISVEDPAFALQLAKEGIGIVLLGKNSAEEALRKKGLILLKPESDFSLNWEILAVYHTYRGLSFAGWAFLRMLREKLKKEFPT